MNWAKALRVSSVFVVIFIAIILSFPLNEKIKLGLDLQGGSHVILECIDTPNAPVDNDAVNRVLEIIRNRIDQLGVPEPILDGKAQITGKFTVESANHLALLLRSGSLPVKVEILENRSIGPTLGRDSISKGIKAGIIGLILILLFMLIYYKGFGLIADFALVVCMVLIVGALAGLKATLTLPGIAGMILTIGMAVDANILIFERIKEELRLEKTFRASIDAGFNKAFRTIFDANVTTLIAAFALFYFGSGPIKGFAVTLSIGILASMFTAIVVTKIVLEVVATKFSSKALL